MSTRLAVLLLRQRGLRHEGPDSGVVFLVGELGEVFLGDPKVFTQAPQLFTDPAQLPLYLGVRP